MKHKFEEMYNNLKLNRKNSNWSKSIEMEKWHEWLAGEVEEVSIALKKDDHENLKEELGDVLHDVMCMVVLAEEKQLFTAKEVIEGAVEKIKRRKPWIFDDNNGLSIEEEKKRWEEAKLKEKKQLL